MFQLLQPIWLFAIAGIAIPIVIHLWDVQGGKRLKVGSILLIEESARLQGRSMRLTDILLLILRCLIIIILAVVLSKPVFKKQLTVFEEKGWLMIDKQSLHEAYKIYKPVIDSLTASGFKFHYFNKGFVEADLANALQSVDSPDLQPAVDYWLLLKQLNELVPPGLPIHVFANNTLKRFNGQRPELSMLLSWHGYTLTDTTVKSIEVAYKMSDDSVRILTASSSNKSVEFDFETVSKSGNSKYTIRNNKVSVAGGDASEEFDIDTSRLDVTIFADQHFTDANYLKAAINAISAYTQYGISATVINNVADVKQKSDWLFWLSDKPLPRDAAAKRIFLYARGKVQIINSWVRETSSAKVGQEPVFLSRRIQLSDSGDHLETIWKDGFGNPLLTLEKKNNSVYHFYSRFNPAWTELPWSAQFAEMIFHLIMPKYEINNDLDKRIISNEQSKPVLTTENKAFDKHRFVKKTDLGKYLWLLAFFVFALERFLSLKSKHVHA